MSDEDKCSREHHFLREILPMLLGLGDISFEFPDELLRRDGDCSPSLSRRLLFVSSGNNIQAWELKFTAMSTCSRRTRKYALTSELVLNYVFNLMML